MVEIRWTPQAIEDINSIAEYIAKDSFRYAKIQTERFFDTAEILLSKPSIGASFRKSKKQTFVN